MTKSSKRANGGNVLNGLVQQLTAALRTTGQGGAARGRQRRTRNKRPARDGSQMVTAPYTAGAIYKPRVPRLVGTREGIIVCNSERLGPAVNTAASGATVFTRLDLVPASFGWLSGVAINYSKFRILWMRIFYIPACPTTTPGNVAMGLSYDNNDSLAGVSVGQVQQLSRGISSPVWAGYEGSSGLNSDSMVLPPGSVAITVDTAKFDKPYYKFATTGQLAAMPAPETGTYVPAALVWATDGGLATTVGNIVVRYEFELIEPIPSPLND